MTARSRSRMALVGAALLALVAPVALVATVSSPANAAASRPHDIKIYKAEKFVSVEGEFPDNVVEADLSCQPGDRVADGMWRIDSVDDVWDDGDFYAGNPLDVHVLWSYPDANKNTWHFKFDNTNWGRAQIHLWVTCIDDKVEYQYWHDHDIKTTGVGVESAATNASFYWNWGDGGAGKCPSGYLPSTPGFKFVTGYGHLMRSRPDLADGGWDWGFKVSGPVNVDLYLSCIRIKVDPSQGHSHALQYKSGTALGHVPFTNRWVEQYDCDGSYKALHHWFDIKDYDHVWFLGMDPRIKSRAYTFMRTSGAVFDDVTYGAVCVKNKTGKQIAF